MKTSLKVAMAAIVTLCVANVQAHPGHDHDASTANVVHAVDGVVAHGQDHNTALTQQDTTDTTADVAEQRAITTDTTVSTQK